jgi:flavorubredoxin
MSVSTYKAAPDIEVLTSSFPILGFGLVPINAFVLKGSEPMLVDTGAVIQKGEFMAALRSVIDPAELRWVWLSHTDFDHIGMLHELLEENPRLRVITSFLSVGIMTLSSPLPLDKVHLLNPGQTITVGSRKLTALRPPTFDNPSTMGFFEHNSQMLFSADCFGALLSEIPQNAADLPENVLRDGQIFWGTVDAPWLHHVDNVSFARELDGIRKLSPELILSGHLPVATGALAEQMLLAIAAIPSAQPFVGPDHEQFQQMLAKLSAGQP